MRTIARKSLKLTVALAGAWVLLSALSSAQGATYFDQACRAHDQEKCLKAAEPKNPDLSEAKLTDDDKTARKAAYEKLRREQLCEAYFYVAQYELIAGRTEKARELLQKCIATNLTNRIEHIVAKAELKRMEPKKK